MNQAVKDFIKKLFPAGIRRKLLPVYHWIRAVAANVRYGFPANHMTVIGVTGTNGKTTTANMLGKILTDAGNTVGIFSSAVIQVGDDWQDSAMKLTTEDVFVLQKKIKEMNETGVTHLVLEVSSHAISQHRILGIPIHGAIFTNLSQDHLDYHVTMEEYAAAKIKLFEKAQNFVVLNYDDEWFEKFLVKPAAMTTTYGRDVNADLRITDEKVTAEGSTAKLLSKSGVFHLELKLSGVFNIYNAAAAIAAARWLGIKDTKIAAGLKALKSVPGRMEEIDKGQPFKVIVDHAHTPDSLTNLLRELKSITEGNLLVLLGADGERDASKREPLAKAAANYADRIIVSDQEPYGDPPGPIREDLIVGLKNAGFENFSEIASRRQAINKLFTTAQKGDTVVLAGMGNQKYRGTAKGKTKWDERTVAREELKKLK